MSPYELYIRPSTGLFFMYFIVSFKLLPNLTPNYKYISANYPKFLF